MEPQQPTKKILLTKPWSGHQAGEVIEEWEVTVDSMIRKGYGTLYEDPKPRKLEREIVTPQPRGPFAETADARGAAEQAVVSPQIGKAKSSKAKPKEP